MEDWVLNEHHRAAMVERIARSTVGIAVENNKGVGTGTLVSYKDQRYVLTAEHVIRGVGPTTIRFWCRPETPIIEKSAKDTTDAEIGKATAGELFPIQAVATNKTLDLALMRLSKTFELPSACQFYELSESKAIADWPQAKLEGRSLFLFGFRVENSRPLRVVGNRIDKFVGCAAFYSRFRSEINTNHRRLLTDKFSAEKDFLFEYTAPEEGMYPGGFSGCGVWMFSENPDQLVWTAAPILIGVSHTTGVFAAQMVTDRRIPGRIPGTLGSK